MWCKCATQLCTGTLGGQVIHSWVGPLHQSGPDNSLISPCAWTGSAPTDCMDSRSKFIYASPTATPRLSAVSRRWLPDLYKLASSRLLRVSVSKKSSLGLSSSMALLLSAPPQYPVFGQSSKISDTRQCKQNLSSVLPPPLAMPSHWLDAPPVETSTSVKSLTSSKPHAITQALEVRRGTADRRGGNRLKV